MGPDLITLVLTFVLGAMVAADKKEWAAPSFAILISLNVVGYASCSLGATTPEEVNQCWYEQATAGGDPTTLFVLAWVGFLAGIVVVKAGEAK